MRSTFSSGVRLALVSLFLLLGASSVAIAQNNPLTVSLTTDRGCGASAVYNIGEPNQFLFSVSKIARVTLTLTLPDGTMRPVRVNMPVVNGVTYSIPGIIGNPPGQRLLTLDAAAGTETAQAQCTYSAGAVTNPLTVTLTTDRGCGPSALSNTGEPITFNYSASKNALVTLQLLRPDGTRSVLAANQAVAGGATQTFTGVIGNPPGQRRLILDAVAGTETAHAECTYTAAGATGGPITLSLTINHGCGGQYRPGDPFIVTYQASADTNLTLIYRRFDGTQFAIFTNRPVMGGQSNTYSATIGNGMGGRTLILDTSPPTPGVQATCAFTIVP